jgi:electron-transferring-flavoprotein dehydrogenase
MMSNRITPLASTSKRILSSRSIITRSILASRSFSTLPQSTSFLARSTPSVLTARSISTSRSNLQAVPVEDDAFDIKTVERVSDEVDVCIVGAGPAGLSAAIRLKQLANAEGRELRVVILEKGPEVGKLPLQLFFLDGNFLPRIIRGNTVADLACFFD